MQRKLKPMEIALICAAVFLVWMMLSGIGNSLKKIISLLRKILKKLESPPVEPSPEASQVIFYVDGVEVKNMDLKVSQKLKASVKFKDKFGNDAKVQEGSLPGLRMRL